MGAARRSIAARGALLAAAAGSAGVDRRWLSWLSALPQRLDAAARPRHPRARSAFAARPAGADAGLYQSQAGGDLNRSHDLILPPDPVQDRSRKAGGSDAISRRTQQSRRHLDGGAQGQKAGGADNNQL